jgi:hypothetical protein
MMRALLLAGIWLVTIETFAADVTSYFISKGNIAVQTNSGAPQLYAIPWIFHARVTATDPTVIQDALISQGPFRDGLIPRGSNSWSIIRSFSTESGFNPFYINANWRLIIDTASGDYRTNELPLFPTNYPAPPRIANFDEAQALNPALPFALQWNAWAGGTANDLISLMILHRSVSGSIVYRSSTTLGDAAAIPGTATSTVIPAGMLQPGKVYLARLRFDAVLATNMTSYPGAPGFSSAFASTDFYITTTGATEDAAPRIVYVSPSEGAVVVSTITPITWAFNKPILTNSFSYQLPSVEFRRTYSPERFLLTFTPTNGAFNQTTQIRWRLNLWDDGVAFADTDGNPLMPERVGTFLTGTTTNLPPAPAAPMFLETRKFPEQFVTTLHGQTNRSYLVMAKTNLTASPTNWSFVTVGQATNALFTLATNTTYAGKTFYRAIALP